MSGDERRPIGFRHRDESTPPPPERMSEVAITRFEHVFEVDPRLMERWVLQQTFPNWDTLRIMNSRHDHLEWIHTHFAERVVHGSEILADLEEGSTGDRHIEHRQSKTTEGTPP